jgi:hypothetical protein
MNYRMTKGNLHLQAKHINPEATAIFVKMSINAQGRQETPLDANSKGNRQVNKQPRIQTEAA